MSTSMTGNFKKRTNSKNKKTKQQTYVDVEECSNESVTPRKNQIDNQQQNHHHVGAKAFIDEDDF